MTADWYDTLHTAEDIAKAREIVMLWCARPDADCDVCARFAERITARAVELGLEAP